MRARSAGMLFHTTQPGAGDISGVSLWHIINRYGLKNKGF